MSKYKKGKIVKGVVSGIETYGAFVSLDEYYTGLIHISEISHGFVKNITDFINIGDTIYVEILEVDEKSFHLKLSIKSIVYKPQKNNRHKRIIETPLGFKTLSYKLPKWIDNEIKNIRKKNIL